MSDTHSRHQEPAPGASSAAGASPTPAPTPAVEASAATAATPTPQLSAAGRPLPQNWLSIIIVIWAGQAVSMVTSYAAGFAAIWYVTETTGNALMLSLMAICAYLPAGLLSPYAGVLADKHNRKAIMIVADGAVGLVSLALGVVVLLGGMSLSLLFILVTARSVGQAFHSPAMLATMPLLVPERHLLRINTLDQLLLSVASIGAPAFGILLYTTLGFHSVLFLDFAGACFAILGLCLAKIPLIRDKTAQQQRVWTNLADGFRAVSATRGLLIIIFAVALGSTLYTPLMSVAPLMVSEHFGGNGYAASIVEAAYGIGMIVGSVVLMLRSGGKRLARLIVVSMVAGGAFTAVAGALPRSAFWVYVAVCVLMAIVDAWFQGPLLTLIQQHVPEEKLGRAMGLNTALMTLAAPLGLAVGGFVANEIGVAAFFVVDGVATVALGVAMYLPRSVRALDMPNRSCPR